MNCTQELDDQKKIWDAEQYLVASQVTVHPDPPQDPSLRNLLGEKSTFFALGKHVESHKAAHTNSPCRSNFFGGVDVSFPVAPVADANAGIPSGDNQSPEMAKSVAVYVVVDRRTMKVVYSDHEYFALDTQYIPTYLAFREINPLERLVKKQIRECPQFTPQAILVDGNGALHPRHAGVACFLGVRTGVPTIGIGKSLFYQGGWTREALDWSMDQFLQSTHTILCDRGSSFSPKGTADLLKYLEDLRGVIFKTSAEDPSTIQETLGVVGRKRLLQEIAPYCNGIALPLLNRQPIVNGDDDKAPSEAAPEISEKFPLLGYALLGHGGQLKSASKSPPGGTSKPIFVSIGHDVSMQEAVALTASLCQSRIPEPVRQADLQGRELMRQQHK